MKAIQRPLRRDWPMPHLVSTNIPNAPAFQVEAIDSSSILPSARRTMNMFLSRGKAAVDGLRRRYWPASRAKNRHAPSLMPVATKARTPNPLLPFVHTDSEGSERTRTPNLRSMTAEVRRRVTPIGDPDGIRSDLHRWETEGGALVGRTDPANPPDPPPLYTMRRVRKRTH